MLPRFLSDSKKVSTSANVGGFDAPFESVGLSLPGSLSLERSAEALLPISLEALGEALGEASMCWSETPKGIFNSNKCIDIQEKLYKDIFDILPILK